MTRPNLFAATALIVLPALASAQDTSLDGLQARIVGSWASIACEIRPQQNPGNAEMAPIPSYLTRDFSYDADGGFSATITVYADAACSIPAVAYDFAGEILWHDANPAVSGAWSQDYLLNEQLELTVFAPPMADELNQLPDGACGEGAFVVGEAAIFWASPACFCALSRAAHSSSITTSSMSARIRPTCCSWAASMSTGPASTIPATAPWWGFSNR